MTASKAQRLAAANKLRHFLASMTGLEDMQAAMPLGSNAPDSPTAGAQEHWRTVLWAVLLRKYFAPKDPLYLPNVLGAMLTCAEGLTAQERAGLVEEQTRIPVLQDVIEFQAGGVSYGEGEIHRLALYGRYLHGEFEKWNKVSTHSSMEMLAVRFVLADQSRRLNAVEKGILRLQEEGRVVL